VRPFGEPKYPVFPIADPDLRAEWVRNDKCPDCGSDLDTGGECTSCEFDNRRTGAMIDEQKPAT